MASNPSSPHVRIAGAFLVLTCLCRPQAADAGESQGADLRKLRKPVFASRLIDGMEDPSDWKLEGKGEMRLAPEHRQSGNTSLEVKVPARTEEDAVPESKRWYGTASAVRRVNDEDWTAFNRLSLWIRPDLPGWRVITVRVRLRNGGERPMPGTFYPFAHTAQLRNREWNRVVWEFPDLPRDRVNGVEFEVRRQGNEPGAASTLTYHLDTLELQRVNADKFEGWDVSAGCLAYSHSGYQAGASKTALASGLDAARFRVLDAASGKPVLSGPVRTEKSRFAAYQVLDFSALRTPGRYVLQAGTMRTQPFRVAGDIWAETVQKVLNFYRGQRCGADVPGVHRVCHRDWLAVSGARKIVMNGGWHDAGDLSQGLPGTAESVSAMLELAETIRERGLDASLRRELIEEAKWGLEWVNKTHLGDGRRPRWCVMGLWTNGILGDNDDVTCDARDDAKANFTAAATEALAARLLKESDPDLADYNLRLAKADWQYAMAAFKPGSLETSAAGVIAGVELFRATGAQEFADQAARMARDITKSQQRSVLPGLEMPLTGFFYTGTERKSRLHYDHVGNEHEPVVALAKLCKTLPDHPEWIDWYAAVVLHSEYYQAAMARLSGPFAMLGNGIYSESEATRFAPALRDAALAQIHHGIPVGAGSYVRMYPVQPAGEQRGNYGTMLAQAKAVSAAAMLRGSGKLADLAQEQFNWILGRNPFAQSTMYGVGHDFQPLYNAMSGQREGALPVGIKSRENGDAPYWPDHNHANYKEVWVHVTARWLWMAADLAGPWPGDSGKGGSFELLHEPAGPGEVLITATLCGAVSQRITLRGHNLEIGDAGREVRLTPGRPATVRWRAKVQDPRTPWVAVALSNGRRREATGLAGAR